MNTDYYFSYLDNLPQVPVDVLPSPQEIIDAPHWSNGEKFESMRHPWAREYYHRKKVTPILKEWLLQNLPFNKFAAGFNIFNTLMNPHRDVRDETYNYILTTGGEVYTEWYNKQIDGQTLATWDSIRPDTSNEIFDKPDEIKTLESVLIEEKRWHRLKTDLVHGTIGDMSGPRIILSVITSDMVPTPKNPLLAEAIEKWFKEW